MSAKGGPLNSTQGEMFLSHHSIFADDFENICLSLVGKKVQLFCKSNSFLYKLVLSTALRKH